jgi:hypothetical protein
LEPQPGVEPSHAEYETAVPPLGRGVVARVRLELTMRVLMKHPSLPRLVLAKTCVSTPVTVCAPDLALLNFMQQPLHPVPRSHALRNGKRLGASDVIKLQHYRVRLATVHARMRLDVLRLPLLELGTYPSAIAGSSFVLRCSVLPVPVPSNLTAARLATRLQSVLPPTVYTERVTWLHLHAQRASFHSAHCSLPDMSRAHILMCFTAMAGEPAAPRCATGPPMINPGRRAPPSRIGAHGSSTSPPGRDGGLVHETGFEPVTFGVSCRCSTRLSHTCRISTSVQNLDHGGPPSRGGAQPWPPAPHHPARGERLQTGVSWSAWKESNLRPPR